MTLGTSRPFAHGGSRLFQFDKTGKFVREIGQDSYAILVAQQVRVDPQDNIWTVDQMSSMVIKFDPNGRDAADAGQKIGVGDGFRPRPLDGQRGGAAAGARRSFPERASRAMSSSVPPMWPGTPPAISISPTATAMRAIAKFDKHGKFIKSWGSTGKRAGPVQHAARHRDRCAG